jgi:hypothetical protein
LQGAGEETCRLSFEHCFHLGDDLRRLAHHLSRKRLKLRAACWIGFPAALFRLGQKLWIFHRFHKTSRKILTRSAVMSGLPTMGRPKEPGERSTVVRRLPASGVLYFGWGQNSGVDQVKLQ